MLIKRGFSIFDKKYKEKKHNIEMWNIITT